MTVNNDDIIITVEDGGFLTIDDINGKALCRQILEINVAKKSLANVWFVTLYPIHDDSGRLSFGFSTKEKANGFLDVMHQVCLDLDKMNSGVRIDTIVKTRVYKYG